MAFCLPRILLQLRVERVASCSCSRLVQGETKRSRGHDSCPGETGTKSMSLLLVGPVDLFGWDTFYPQGKLGREQSFSKDVESHFTDESTCKGAESQPAHGSGEGFSNAGS
jgi:hypothetical protein